MQKTLGLMQNTAEWKQVGELKPPQSAIVAQKRLADAPPLIS